MKLLIRIRERMHRFAEGQTMTEYALILAAIAVVVYITYKGMGNEIGSLVSAIDTDLSTAA